MSEKTVRVALYARVSTVGQQSVPAQLPALREYAHRRGWVKAAGGFRGGVVVQSRVQDGKH